MTASQDVKQPILLLADDGEPASDVAWAWVTSHRWAGWDLQTLTVRQTSMPTGADPRHSRFARRDPPAEAGFTASDHLEVNGDPRRVLLGRVDASLMVMGCHHPRHLVGLPAGSTTEWLLARPPAPLLIARHGHGTRSVAFCADGSPHSQRAFQAFWSLPWSTEVAVNLVSVDDGHTDVDQALKRAHAALPGDIWPAAVGRLSGSPKRELTAFVRAYQVDLVLLGARGLSGRMRTRVGSTVSALLKDGAANLMVVPVRA